MKFTVALLQIAAFGNDQSRNLAKGLQYCGEAKALGADLAVFPELWNIGFTRSPIDFEARQLWAGAAIDQRSTFFQSFATLAREIGLEHCDHLFGSTPAHAKEYGFHHRSARRGDAELLQGVHL